MRAMRVRVAGVALMACMAGPAVAADGVWTSDAGGNWADPANWQDGVVAGGAEATASFPNTPTAYRTVVLPPEGVTLGKLTYDRHGTDYQVRFRGGPMLFDAVAPEIAADYYFAIFYNDLMGSNGLTWRYGGVVGTDTSYTGPTSLAGGIVYDYMHLGALSQAASISNYLSTGPLLYKGGALVVSGRRDSAATSSTWQLTAGDTIVRRVADYLAASPGAAVSGDGIPAGTFVKHSIDLDSFELSQPATLSGSVALSFGAMAGSASHQQFERIEMQASGFIELATNGGSLTRVQADDLTGGLFLTLRLQGDGTLALKGGESFGGTMELSGGTFEHLAKTPGVQPALSNLTVTAKTVFSVPEPATTSTLVNVSGLGELVKTGGGAVVMQSAPGPDSRLTVENGTLTVTTQPTPTSLVEGAWFHVDAGDAASLTLVNENGTNFVTQWRDTRANGRYAAAVEGAPLPLLREGFQNGLPVVDFGSFHFPGVGIFGYGAYLSWSEPCTAIREVFLVFSDTPDTVNISAGANYSFLLGNPDRYDFHRSNFGGLFNDSYGHPNLREGVIAVDGVRVPYSYRLPSGFHVISLATTGPVAASLFANDRNASFGGQRLAEVLIFDHALEVSQRQDVGAYLMNKWLDRAYPGYRSATESGVGLLKLQGDGTFTVGEGEELRVGTLDLGGDIVKNGKGTLAAEVIRETGGSLSVADGSVALCTRAAASAPAAGAWFHVDASDPASLTLVNENGTNYVTQWSDVRTNGVFASSPEGAPRPFLREGFQNGLPVVDFGSFFYVDRIGGYGAYLNWNATGWGIREVFLVFSDTPDCVAIPAGVNWSFLLGHDWAYNFHRNFNGVLFHPDVASPNLLNGAISVDGTTGSYLTALTPGFHVVSLSPTGPVAASTFARDRDASRGGQRLAEVLVYDRVLGPTERRDTENYLLRKWLGVAAPGYAGGTVRMSGITFTGNADLAVDGASSGLELDWLTADGALKKEGAGAMSIGSLRSGVTDIDVADGQLTVACDLKQPWFHVDASDPASLTLVEENGQKYVTRWNDVRTNGVFAASPEGAPRPILRDGFQNGLPVVDFGSFRYVSQGYEGYGAYLNWSAECAAIREVFLVFSDTPDCVDIRDGCNWSFLLGHQGDLYHFHRNFNGVLFHPEVASPSLLGGAITVDGATATYATALTSGFHVINLSPTGPVAASAFARDRNASTGGQRLAEVLIYTDVLSDTERQGIREHLISKWKNTRAFGQLRAAAGGSVALTDSAVVAGTLEGAGSVSAVRVTASEVSAGDAAGEIGTLSVAGTLELAAGAVVPVDCAPPACDRIEVSGTLRLMGGGTFAVNCPISNFGDQSAVLFTFSAVEGAEHLVSWTVTGDICAMYTVRPRIEGNQLLLAFTTKGTLLLLK